MRTPKRGWIAPALLLLLALPASAEQGYVGAGVGGANVNKEIDLVTVDDTAPAFKIFGGYRFTDHFGLEFSYADFGEQEGTMDTATVKTRVTGWTGEAMGMAPVGERFEVFGKFGLFYADTEVDSTGGVLPSSRSTSDIEFTVGVGGAYKFKHVAIRAELEYFSNEELSSIFMLSVGFEYRF